MTIQSVVRMGEWVEKLVGPFQGTDGRTDELVKQLVEQIEESVEDSKELMGGAVGGVGGTHAGINGDVIRKFNEKKRNI